MTPSEWQRLKEHLATLLPLGPSERSAYFAALGDNDLRVQLEQWLAHSLATAIAPGGITWSTGQRPQESAQPADPSFPLIGPYRIVGPLGSGGMGQVFKAVDQRLGLAAAVRFDETNDDIDSFGLQAVRLLQHHVRLAYARAVAEVDLEPAPLGASDQVEELCRTR